MEKLDAVRTRFECTLGSGSAFGTESRERASLEFRGIQSYPYPLPSCRPLSLGNPRAPALVVFPSAPVPTQATRMSPTIESIATPAAGRLRARAFTRAVESSRIQARASPPAPHLHGTTCGRENINGGRCRFARVAPSLPFLDLKKKKNMIDNRDEKSPIKP